MQFSIATLAVLATAVMAESTLYITEEVTITSCAESVTDCPSKSTVVSLTSYPVITASAPPVVEYPTEEAPETLTQYTTLLQTITSCGPTVTDCPYGSVTSTVVPVHPTASPEYPTGNSTGTYIPEQPMPTSEAAVEPTTLAPVVPAPSVVTVTITECPAETPAQPTKPVEEVPYPIPEVSKPVEETPAYPTAPVVPVAPIYPTGTAPAVPVYPTGTGAVVPSKTPVFTGAASVNSVSVLAFAGVIAAIFA